MKEEELKYIDFHGTRYVVPEKAVTIDGSLEFTDAQNDGNIEIAIIEEEEDNNG